MRRWVFRSKLRDAPRRTRRYSLRKPGRMEAMRWEKMTDAKNQQVAHGMGGGGSKV